jgi:hypothetical protein
MTRIRSQVETRSETCERWLPLWRALVQNRMASPQLAKRIDFIRDRFVARLELMYRPELATLPPAERKRLLMGLESLTDFESWERLRERHRLSIEAARRVWIETIDRLLPPTPAAD